MNQEIRDRLIRGRVQLYRSNPFFAYLVLRMNMKEFGEDMEKHLKSTKREPTMAVDSFGNLWYSPDFVKTLDDDTLKMVLCHEVLHIALDHLVRKTKGRDMMLWNVATDICINDLLLTNGFKIFIASDGDGILQEA